MAYVGAVNDGYVVKVELLLLCLLGEDVTVVSVTSFNLTCSSERETLLCTRISLYFWHFLCCLIDYYYCGYVRYRTQRASFLLWCDDSLCGVGVFTG